MANSRPTEERIAELDKKLDQIKAQKRALQNRSRRKKSSNQTTDTDRGRG